KFLMDVPTGRDVLKVKKLSIGYDRPLVEPLDFIVKKGEKVAITGKNGIGKSTLIKTLNEVISPLDGSFEWIDTANVLYFEQDINLEEKYTPFEMIHAEHTDYDRKQIYSILATFGIDYEKAMRPINTLSGGEKTKVKLAISRNIKSNVLILDEPTNHLDAMAKDALMDALIEYQGTVILVSHEKKFYSEICDYEIHLENT